MKDAVATMGHILPDDTWGRDAVHVAVFSAYSKETLYPGMKVAIVNEEGDKDVRVSTKGAHIGIVDPFLDEPIRHQGQRFWVYLFPRTITALSHRWSHPAFEKTDSVYSPPAYKLLSEKFIRDFAEKDGVEYEDVIDAITCWLDSDQEGSPCYGIDHNYEEIPEALWQHLEIVLGRTISAKNRPAYFRCTC